VCAASADEGTAGRRVVASGREVFVHMMKKPVIAVIGAGMMGSSHARIVSESTEADLGLVVDSNADAAELLAQRYWARASTHLEDAMSADAVIVACSSAAHLECALPFIEAGVPTFVEKPIALSLTDVDALIDAASKYDVPIMCGFVERFNAAYRTAQEQLTQVPTHLITLRHSPPAPRIASSVVADMLLHDLDVAVQLFADQEPQVVGAACDRPTGTEHYETADCIIRFPTGLATLSTNRTTQRKVRFLNIHTAAESIEVDLLRQDVTVYRHVSQEMMSSEGLAGYRASTEVDIPFVRHRAEPLALQFEHFLQLAAGRSDHDVERNSIRLPHVLMEAVERGQAPASSSMAATQSAVASEP
jgi:predicted dehydrogenase